MIITDGILINAVCWCLYGAAIIACVSSMISSEGRRK